MAAQLDTFSLVAKFYVRLSFLVLALWLFFFNSVPAYASLLDCDVLKKDWSSISADASYDEKVSLYDQAYNDSDCDGVTIAAFGTDIIDSQLDSVVPFDSLGSFTGNAKDLEETLLDLQEFGEHWRLSYFLGEIYRQQKKVLPALRAYQEALGLVDDEELTPEEPEHRMIARLRD